MTPRQFMCLLAVIVIAIVFACVRSPEGFHKLATHVAGLVG